MSQKTIRGFKYTNEDLAAVGRAIDEYVIGGTRSETDIRNKTRELFTARRQMQDELSRQIDKQVLFTKTHLKLGKSANDTIGVSLGAVPAGNVTITPTANNTGISFSPSTLTFSTSNYATPQNFTVSTGGTTHGDPATMLCTGTNGGYDGIVGAVMVVIDPN